MNPRRTLQENESALRKVLTQRQMYRSRIFSAPIYPPAWTLWGTSQRGQRCSAGT